MSQWLAGLSVVWLNELIKQTAGFCFCVCVAGGGGVLCCSVPQPEDRRQITSASIKTEKYQTRSSSLDDKAISLVALTSFIFFNTFCCLMFYKKIRQEIWWELKIENVLRQRFIQKREDSVWTGFCTDPGFVFKQKQSHDS